MLIEQKDTIAIITQQYATIIELVKKIQALYPKFKNNHIIICLTSSNIVPLKDVLEFQELSNTHKNTNQSFVIVSNTIDLNRLPDVITVVPTMLEAYDIIDMEAMERDLGF